jgi:hypothetical protein
MKKTWFAMLSIVLCASNMLAQQPEQLPTQPPQIPTQPIQPVQPPPVVGAPVAAYPAGYSYIPTPAEGALNGIGNVISSRGNYNLSTSAAAINMTLAERNSLQNQLERVDTFFQKRQMNQAYQAQERGPRLTQEDLARIARAGVPAPLSPGDVNPVSGQINWPGPLTQDSFSADRTALEQLSANKATHGTLSSSDQMTARKTIESMFAELKSQIQDIPSQDYIASKNFLNSMIYELAHTDLS